VNNTYRADESVARSNAATQSTIWSTFPFLPDLAVLLLNCDDSLFAEKRIPDIVVLAEVVQDVNCDN